MIRFRISSLGAAAVLAAGVAPVRADEPDIGPDAAASALFEEGRTLVDAGEWESGCDKLAQSMDRYAAASTIMNLARCAEHFGEVATAWARYKRGLVLNRDTPGEARRAALEKIAQEGIAALEPRLPRLKVVVRTAGGDTPPGVRVLESGRPLAVGSAVVLDPGARTLVASAPGFVSVEQTVQLVEGQVAVAELVLAPAPEPTSIDEPAPPPAPAPDVSPVVPADPDGPPWWAWAGGGAGLALAGLSVGFAIDAVSVASSLEDRCGEDLVCDEDPSFDPEPDNDRKTRDIALSVGLGAGAVGLLGVAVVGFLIDASGPETGRSSPRVWADPARRSAGLAWGAAF